MRLSYMLMNPLAEGFYLVIVSICKYEVAVRLGMLHESP